MNYFFAEGIGESEIFKLDERESHHASNVLRLQPGEHIMLLDGNGGLYEGEIIEVGKKNTTARILDRHQQPKYRNYYLHIAIAPTKSSDRFDMFLEKATEIGIDEITPVISQNSERRNVNIEKAKQTILAAIKQSGNAWIPVLNETTDLKKFLTAQKRFPGHQLICHCRPGEKHAIATMDFSLQHTLILIGPEGDFTQDEITLAVDQGFRPSTMGEARLRTETAGILACSIISTIHQLRK